MRSFTDCNGRTWSLIIDVSAVKRVRGLVQVNLLEAVEGNLIERFYRDPVLLGDVLYALCKPQADEKQISDEEFGRGLAGDAIEAATTAFLEELVSFFPNPRDRVSLTRVLETTNRMLSRARDLIEQNLASGKLEREIESMLARANGSSGSAPASPVSIRDPAPSAN